MNERKFITLRDLDYGDLQDVIWDDIFKDEDAKNNFKFLLTNGFLRVVFPKGTVLKAGEHDETYTIKGKEFDLYVEYNDVRRIK